MKEQLVAEITYSMQVAAILFAAKQFTDETQADRDYESFMAGGAEALMIMTRAMNEYNV